MQSLTVDIFVLCLNWSPPWLILTSHLPKVLQGHEST